MALVPYAAAGDLVSQVLPYLYDPATVQQIRLIGRSTRSLFEYLRSQDLRGFAPLGFPTFYRGRNGTSLSSSSSLISQPPTVRPTYSSELPGSAYSSSVRRSASRCCPPPPACRVPAMPFLSRRRRVTRPRRVLGVRRYAARKRYGTSVPRGLSGRFGGKPIKVVAITNNVLQYSLTGTNSVPPTVSTLATLSSLASYATGTSVGPVTNGAMTYMMLFSLSQAAQFDTGYAARAALYDSARIDSIKVTLTPPVNPITNLNAAVPTTAAQLNFGFMPQVSDAITWFDRDGQFGFPVVVPPLANGDYTALVANRTAARRHPAFKRIVRVIYPQVTLDAAATQAGGPSGSLATISMRLPRNCYVNNPTNTVAFAGLGLSVPYMGPINTLAAQIIFNYDVQVEYRITLADPVF
jgi:hypothetical protein